MFYKVKVVYTPTCGKSKILETTEDGGSYLLLKDVRFISFQSAGTAENKFHTTSADIQQEFHSIDSLDKIKDIVDGL